MPEIKPPNDWSLAVLVGGRGRRLGGRAKGNLRLEGRTLLERALALAPHFAEALLVGDDAGAYPEISARRVPDVVAGAGAPAGLVSALLGAQTPWVLVIACDMPGASLEAAQALSVALAPQHEGACFVDGAGRLHPFPGLYRAALGAPLRAQLVDRVSVQALLAPLALARVPLPDAPWARAAVANVNTWEDARALGLDADH